MEAPQPIYQSAPNNKVKLIIIALVVLIILVAGAIFLSNSSMRGPSISKDDEKVVATVAGEKVLKGDIRKQAEKSYTSNVVDDKIIDQTTSQVLERKIIDIESQKNNIIVTDSEINDVLKYRIPNQDTGTVSAGYKESVKYQLLRDKITQAFVASRTAFVIGFWVSPISEEPSMPTEERTVNQTQRRDGLRALNDIEIAVKDGQNPIDIVKAMIIKYPSLDKKLSINNYIYSVNNDLSRMSHPGIYTYQTGDVWKLFFDTLFLMKKDDTIKIANDSGSGGAVIHLIDSNNAVYKTYDEWLAAKKKELIQ